MEAIIAALVSSGPIGILAALEALVIVALWLSLKDERRERLEDLRRCIEALVASTDAIEESNMGRQSLADALKSFGDGQLQLLGRVERLAALVENAPSRRVR